MKFKTNNRIKKKKGDLSSSAQKTALPVLQDRTNTIKLYII